MRDDVARDLSASAYDFQRVVWPAIGARLGGGELRPVEATVVDDFRHDLDTLAGIDAWQVFKDGGVIRGLASRVQWVQPDWPEKRYTFTIRHQRPNGRQTEYAKRCYALDHQNEGWLLPHFTIQAYVTKPKRGGALLAVAAIETTALYKYARKYPKRQRLVNPDDGVTFTAWRWRELQLVGCKVAIVDARSEAA